jgi:LL-diaminopimelate aminotransferase
LYVSRINKLKNLPTKTNLKLMAFVNEHFLKLPGSYLFSDIAKKVNAFKEAHPDKQLIRLGIGDVTRPLPRACIEAMHKATDEMANKATFRGYSPEQGYDFLIEAIIKNDYAPRGIQLTSSEVFVSDGAKSDTGNIGDILHSNNSVGVTDPVYPVYIDSNVMGGRSGVLEENGRWSNLIYIPCTSENNFVPQIPDKRIDMLYLCYPNNPTGTTLTKSELKRWVDYALANDTLILFDAAYEAYIQEPNVPHSIYEIEGAKNCAIEFRSFSKKAGFTGVRCGYNVVPKELTAATLEGKRVALNFLWNRRQSTKFNGTSYITQRAAEAVYSPEGKEQVKEIINYYMTNAKIMREGLETAGLKVYGGINAPYLWVKTPNGIDSWTFFDKMLNEANVVGTPGVGFGPSGQGYLRLTAFGEREDCVEAVQRLNKELSKK